jgi:hypothetical protein
MDKEYCIWEENEDGNWEYCGGMYCFEVSGPEENGFKYCPACGSLLYAKKYDIDPYED